MKPIAPRPRPPGRRAFMPGTLVRFGDTLIWRPWISVSFSSKAFATASGSKNSMYANLPRRTRRSQPDSERRRKF